MKLLQASSIVLATSAAPTIAKSSSSRKNLKSAASVRLLQKLASRTSRERDLQLFGSSFGASSGASSGNCGETSFLGLGVDLEASCNGGCIPDFANNSCERFCNDDGTVDANANADMDMDAVATAKQRLGIFGSMSASELMCGNCDFYRCCTGETSYENCESSLPEMDSLFSGIMDEDWGMPEDFDMGGGDWDMGDSGFEDLIDSIIPDDWGMAWGEDGSSSAVASGTEQASGLSFLGQVVDSFVCPKKCAEDDLCEIIFSGEADFLVLASACDKGCLPTVSSCAEFCGDDSDNMLCESCEFLACCGNGDESAFGTACQDIIPNLDEILSGSTVLVTSETDHDDSDWGISSAWGGSDSASGISVLSELFAGLNCPDTCGDTKLCNSFFLGMGDETVLSKACNSGCLPEVSSCDDICGNADGAEFMGSVVDMACDSCKFLDCCAGEDGFDICKGNLPEMGNLLIDWDTTLAGDWNYSSLVDLDWDGIEEALGGLSELADNLHSLFDEALAEFDAFSVRCNPETCPIDGVCDMSYDLANVNFENVCGNGALFECMEGLEEMCTSQCNDGSVNNLGIAAFCSLCDIAICCEGNGDSTSFEECALESTAQSMTDVFDQLPSVLEDLQGFVEDIVDDMSIPEFCPEVDGTVQCEVEGFCGIFNGDFTNFDMDDTCKNNAFFECGPDDLEEMCTDQCGSGTDADATIVAKQRLADNALFDAAFCSLCSVARCCRDKEEGVSFLDACALDSLPEQFATAHTNTPVQDSVAAPSSDSSIEESESIEDTQAEASSSDSGTEEDAVTSDTITDPSASGPSVTQNEIPESIPAGDPPSEPIVEESVSSSPDTTDNNSASGPDVILASIESSVERSNVPDSGSLVSGISAGIILASIATLVLVSF